MGSMKTSPLPQALRPRFLSKLLFPGSAVKAGPRILFGRGWAMCPTTIEPFAGSLAVLLARPEPAGLETVNDLDCLLVNFWRATQADPRGVARHACWPASEADLVARNHHLATRDHLSALVRMDPDFYDVRLAGWWVWCVSLWIGSGACELRDLGKEPPVIAGRSAPLVKLPRIGMAGVRARRVNEEMLGFFEALRDRLKNVRITCGDWPRVLTPANTPGVTGILLDPPYSVVESRAACYANDSFSVAQEVAQWARQNGRNKRLRIALCGYDGEHDMPGWECIEWKANGGYANRNPSNKNRHRERIWFSPGCLKEK